MRCYFHLVGNDDTILDDVGVEVADLAMAEIEALKAIQELKLEEESSGDVWRGWQLNVTDEAGHLLLVIPLEQSTH